MSNFKTKIKEKRQAIGMTQEELAKAVNVRRETIIYLEQGKYVPSLKLALRVSSIFKCPVEDIFEFTENQLWKEEL